MLSLQDAVVSLEQPVDLPSMQCLTNTLQKCKREKKNIACAKELHLHVCESGLEVHEGIGNHVVQMFVECGGLLDAQKVFNKLTYRNEFSWTALMQGFMDCNDLQHVLSLYQQMQYDGVHPSKYTFMVLLNACTKLKHVKKGLEMHADIAKQGYDNDYFMGSRLVEMYAKFGLLEEAQEVFDELPIRDVISWTVLISGYVDQGLNEEAFSCFQVMKSEGFAPDGVTFVCCLKACGALKAMDKGQRIHEEVEKLGFMRNPSVASALVEMYFKCGSLAVAREVFEKLPVRDVSTWNALMTGYLEQGSAAETLNCFQQMHIEGVCPDAVSYICGLRACGIIGAIHKGREIHSEVKKSSYRYDPFIGSTVVDMYAKCGSVLEARKALDELPVRETVSWTALIAGYIELNLNEEALHCLEQMQQEGKAPDTVTFVCGLKACCKIGAIGRGQEIHMEIVKNGLEKEHCLCRSLVDMYAKCGLLAEAKKLSDELQVKDTISWTALIAGYAEHGLSQEALYCLENMQEEGVILDAVILTCGLKACGSIGAIHTGLNLHKTIIQEEYDSDQFVGSSLVDMYAKCGLLTEAQDCFDALPTRDAVSWTALIAAYAEQGLGEAAMECYKKMQGEGVSPNAVTFGCSLKACGLIGAISMGHELHTEVIREGYEKDQFVGTNLIDMYAKCGFLEAARETLCELPVRDAMSWNTLITGYTEHGLGEEALSCLSQMQLEGMSLDVFTYICGLKACTGMGAIDRGQDLHAQIVVGGHEGDHFISSTLVDMYAKCASFAEAESIFNNLLVQDAVSWNALVSGYVECGLIDEALNHLKHMQIEGVSSTAVTYACRLKVFGGLGNIDKGQEVHSEIITRGYDRDNYIQSTLVIMYSKFGLLKEAWLMCSNLLLEDVTTWNALITGYAEHGQGEEALHCFDQMQVPPNSMTYICALKICGSIGAINRGQITHMEIIKQVYEEDPFVGSSLVDMYAKCGLLADAQEVFTGLPVRDVVSWTALISGFVEYGFNEESLHCFEEMQAEGVSPDAVTFACTLRACGNLGLIQRGQELHSELVKMGHEKISFLGQDLVQMYGKCGLVSEARAVLKQNPTRDVLLWTALMMGFAEQGLHEEVLACLEQMVMEEIYPDAVTFVCSLKACSCIGDIDKGREIHADIIKKGLETDPLIGNTLVGLYAKCGLLVETQEEFGNLLFRDVVSWTSVIARYQAEGLFEEALDHFQDMQLEGVCPDAVSWNVVIMGYAEQGELNKVCNLVAKMQEQGGLPDSTILVSMLKACGNAAALEIGQKIHAQVVKASPSNIEVDLATALTDMYGKCGSMVDAQCVFDGMSQKDLVMWNALITGYARLGESESVFLMLEKMRECSIQPDGVTFLNLLTVCSHMGLVDQGQKYFELMSSRYGIGPSIKHQNCLIDLLGRAGQLDEAVVSAESMPSKPDDVVWSTVLGACQKWGDVGIGKQVFEHAEKSDETHTGKFILMSNLYADSRVEENQRHMIAQVEFE